MDATTTPVVALEAITKAYPGVVANDRIDIDLYAGEIHAIVGENGAGKTTLMGILYGLHRPDSGHIAFDGRRTPMTSPRDALALGLGYVQQHFSLIPALTVSENIVLAQRGARGGARISPTEVARLGERWDLSVDLDARIEDLSVGDQQRAELLKALAGDLRVLILDEPDALLTAQEWDELAAVLRRLAARGIGIFLVSHKLRAVTAIADRITVLRRGRLIATLDAEDADESTIAQLMVGELRTEGANHRLRKEAGEVVLRVSDLMVGSDRGDDAVQDVSLTARAGEVLGVVGVEGNGQVELTEALAGARPAHGGSIMLRDLDITTASVSERQRLGVSHVPADRRNGGLVGSLSITENLLLPEIAHRPYSRGGVLRTRAMGERAETLIREFDIHVHSPEVAAETLSGGNQQRLVLARELSRPLVLLVCCYATRGLDVASAQAVCDQIRALRRRGAAILWASLDLDELLEVSDRIIVLHDGRVTGELPAAEANAERLGLMMSGRAES